MSDENQQKAVFVDEATQKHLNQPLQMESSMDDESRQFLEMIISLVNNGKINLYRPSTLINSSHYDTLDEQKQGGADMEAMNMLSAIRDIKGLHDAGYMDSYQMKNLVERLKESKERLEENGGDLFII